MDEPIRVAKPRILEEIPADESTVVEASAGTGKTYALEHLIVELILEREFAISNILVVTFTQRATAELVERVRGILQRLVDRREGGADPDEPHWVIDSAARRRLREALFSFDRAPIYTIHGFCHRVLVEHAFANRQPFEQELAESEELFEEAFNRALREDFTTDPARSLVVETYVGAHSIDELRSDLATAVATSDRVEPVGDFEAFAESVGEFREAVESFRSTLGDFRTVLEEVDREGGLNGNKRAKIWRQVEALERSYRAYEERGLNGFVGTLNAEADEPFAYLGDRSILNRSHRDRYRDGWESQLEELAGFNVDPRPLIFDEFVPLLERHLDRSKAEQGVFTYDDMLEMVRGAVCDDAELVEALREEYQFALVDEFQDTDPVQWEIVRELFVESGGDNPCVLIGDPKQAIYGFRGADVRTYFRARDEVIGRGDLGRPVTLGANYRSTGELIDAYNALLEEGAPAQFFHPPNTYPEPVDCGDDDKALVGCDGERVAPVVVTEMTGRGDDGFTADEYRRGLAEAWASEIRELLTSDGGSSPLRIREDREGGGRRLEASDIYVLTRTRSGGDRFAEYLRAVGVPHAFYKREGLFETPEAEDWYRVLRAVVRPDDRSRRLKAWTTPFFGLGLAEAAEADEAADDRHELFDRLNEWNGLARAGRIGQLVQRISDRTGVLRRQIFGRHGERELTNYEHLGETFVDWAQSDDLAADEIVARLGRYVAGEAEPEGREADMQRLETEQQAVQIMTMHKAKGLSAPVVFLFGGYKYLNRPPYRFYDGDERVLFFGSKRGRDAIDAYRQEEAERLLYVAMTRPEGRLYLPYAEREEHGGDLSRSKSPMGPLVERLEAVLEDGPPPGIRLEERTAGARPPGAGRGESDRSKGEGADVDAAALLREAGVPDPGESVDFGELRADRRLFVESYSSVDRWRGASDGGMETDEALELREREEADDDPAEAAGPEGPPAGRRTGLAVHALLEDLPYETAADSETLEAWRGRAEVAEVFDSILAHYGLEAHRRGLEGLVWRALISPVAVPGLEIESVASVDRRTAELEFWYPIPGETVPSLPDLLGADESRSPSPSRGYLRGFIDLVFEVDGRIYAADWKTNWLRGEGAYAAESVREVVEEDYEVQAILYATAAARLVARSSGSRQQFRERFGGLMYLFVRGMEPAGRRPTPGVYFERPDFAEICDWERRAGELVGEKLEARREQIASGGHDRWRAL